MALKEIGMTRVLMAATAAYFLTCGFAAAQVAGSGPAPLGTPPPLGMTYPLGPGRREPDDRRNSAAQASNNEQQRDVRRHQVNRRQRERWIKRGCLEPRVPL